MGRISCIVGILIFLVAVGIGVKFGIFLISIGDLIGDLILVLFGIIMILFCIVGFLLILFALIEMVRKWNNPDYWWREWFVLIGNDWCIVSKK